MKRLLAIAATTAALLALPAGARADSLADFAISANADAHPVEASLLSPGVSGVPLADGRYPHAQAELDSPTSGRAQAATFDPGALVDTVSSQGRSSGAPLPDYPFIARADAGNPSATGSMGAQAVGPASVSGGDYQAAVGNGTAQASATGAQLALGGGPGGGITLGGGSAHASSTADGSGTVRAQARQSLQHVVLFGAVAISSLAADATATDAAGGAGNASGHLQVGAVTVAGQAATIDAQGIHLLGRTAPLPSPPVTLPTPASSSTPGAGPGAGGAPGLPPLPGGNAAGGPSPGAQQVLDHLSQLGIGIRLVGSEQQQQPGYVSYAGSAVEVTERFPDGTQLTVDLGGLAVDAVAAPGGTPGAGFGLGSGFAGYSSVSGSSASGFGDGGGGGTAASAASSRGIGGRLAALALTPRALLYALLAVFVASSTAVSVIATWSPAVRRRAASLVPL